MPATVGRYASALLCASDNFPRVSYNLGTTVKVDVFLRCLNVVYVVIPKNVKVEDLGKNKLLSYNIIFFC